MPAQKKLLWLVNIIGGIAVLGSYALGVYTHPEAGRILWGNVPESIRPFYNVNMLLAAAGYFAFLYFILFRLDAEKICVAGRFGYGLFPIIFTAILIPSALWMPLTLLAVERSSLTLVWAVRIVLWLVALSSMVLFLAILKVETQQSQRSKYFALAGSGIFCLQTVFLDAIVWVIYFNP
ncbi:MAG: hypothetical protein GYA15_08930 [Leptolinea sp.]|jgi:hypothetical protein|nr:hypothetical protein [Leptolinea sp.]